MTVDAGLAVPGRSLAQRMDALERANAVRSARAELKRRMKRGEVAPADVLAEPPAQMDTMRVRDVLLATPAVGPVKATKILRECEVSSTKTIGGLSPRQRRELAADLAGRLASPRRL